MSKIYRTTNEDPYRFAYAQMILCGIDVYIKLGTPDTCVIDDGTLKLCWIKRLYDNRNYLTLSLTEKEQDVLISATSRFNCVCGVDVTGLQAWLIPCTDIPTGRTIRMTKQYDEYKLTYRREHRLATISLEGMLQRENIGKTVANVLAKHKNDGCVELDADIKSLLDKENEDDK